MARIRLGMVGGGNDAFIGGVHRIASRIDGHFDLVAGALSSTPDKARASGEALGLDPARTYGSFEEMAEAEAARPDGIEAVSIVTPNHMHFAAASAFLSRGIHVICDKPLTATFEDAEAMERAVAELGRAVHPDAQLYRLSDGAAGARDGRRRADRRRSGWCRSNIRRTG